MDVFRVRPMPGTSFPPAQQQHFAEELTRMVALLDDNRVQDVRRAVNRRLIETLGRSRSAFSGLLYPIHIRFDNEQSPTDTVMDIRSTDTPAFLYAFANALTIRGLYIRKAQFEHVGAELHDRFYVRDRHERKIGDPAEQQELRLTAALIKQFTHFLTWAPDPAKAIEYFDRFLDQIVEESRSGRTLAFLKDKKTLALLAKLLGTSDFLWEDFLRRQHANLLPMLDNFQRQPLIRPRGALVRDLRRHLAKARGPAQRRRALNHYKDQELFRIDMKHLLEPESTLPEFSQALTDLAEVILDQAVRDGQALLARLHGKPRLADGNPCSFSIFGLGKFGGRELGYASDIEVLFVYGGAGRTTGPKPLDNSEYFERLTQEVIQSIEAKQEGIFHLDVRLRPHGGKGLLANSLDELQAYYSPTGLSAPFERQALIKLRFVAGDATLGKQVEAHRDSFVYSGAPWDLATAIDLRREQLKQLVERGTVNVKLSPGGVIDIEYAVQYLQVMHGHQHAVLRTPNTMQALAGLVECGIVGRQDGENLRKAYFFIRMLIDGLRMVRGNAKDLVLPPSDSDEFIFLARRVGYTTDDWQSGARHLQTDIE
ncbi:MAG: glutamine synthetase adenylyltransferase, partial [Nitrospira sp.]|nr:glutamine synthetase adenylyltransferase [Nitrospira sp.]